MTPAEFKSQEGSRLQALHGALGTLPALALVFASDITQVAPGAPFFTAAIILVIGSYVHWNSTDTIFWLTIKRWIVGTDDECSVADDYRERLIRSGGYHVVMNHVYAIATLVCCVAGFAGVYSSIRLGVSAEVGFLAVGFLLIVVAIEIVFSRQNLARLIRSIQDIVVDEA